MFILDQGHGNIILLILHCKLQELTVPKLIGRALRPTSLTILTALTMGCEQESRDAEVTKGLLHTVKENVISI